MNDPYRPGRRATLVAGLSALVGGAIAPRVYAQSGETTRPNTGTRRSVHLGVDPFVAAGDGRRDDSGVVRAAFATGDPINQGAFTVSAEEGAYSVTGSGPTLITIRGGTRFLGASLEGTRFRAAGSATARALLSDDDARSQGSAAKVEIYNLTLDGGGNPRLAALLDLGTGGSVPFGTYGRLDNLMARDAPNATAFALSVNIGVVGDVYSVNTRDGLVTADGGSGCHVRGMYPYGFSRYGIRLGGIGDNVLNGEGEAPTSDDAVYIYGANSFVVGLGSHIVSVAPGTTMKRPFVIDTVTVGDWALGPWHFVRSHRDQRFGDFARPVYTGRATAVGANTLTDATKTWERDELKGWAIRIMSGPGAGNWAEIARNSADTLEVISSNWVSTGPAVETAPAIGSRYALAPALCRASGGGFASSKVLTLAEAVVRALFARSLRVGSLLVGPSNHAAAVSGLQRRSVPFAATTIAPGARLRILVPAQGVAEGAFITASAPALREAGLSVEADVVAGGIAIYIGNPRAQMVPAPQTTIGLLAIETA